MTNTATEPLPLTLSARLEVVDGNGPTVAVLTHGDARRLTAILEAASA